MAKWAEARGRVPAGLPYGLGAVFLGGVGLAVGDFALQWQPVPADVPGPALLAYAAAAVLTAGGVGVLFRRTRAWSALGLAVVYAAWTVVLHGPRVVAAVDTLARWNAFCEIAALSAGGAILFSAAKADAWPPLPAVARRVFGLCLLVFGSSHLVYLSFTASMVPEWFPARTLWAAGTGLAHIAAGLALITGVKARLAAGLLSLMFAGFVLLLHVPRLIAHPELRLEWTMTAVAVCLTGAAVEVFRSLTADAQRRLRQSLSEHARKRPV